jgi:hypothetical protein
LRIGDRLCPRGELLGAGKCILSIRPLVQTPDTLYRSSINWMVYTRGQRHDFDSWNTKGWSADELLPFLKKVCFWTFFPAATEPRASQRYRCLIKVLPEGLGWIQTCGAAEIRPKFACRSFSARCCISPVPCSPMLITHQLMVSRSCADHRSSKPTTATARKRCTALKAQ